MAKNKISSFASERRSPKDGALVFFEDFQPTREIVAMANFGEDVLVSAEKGAHHFGNEFFAAIIFGAVFTGEFAI